LPHILEILENLRPEIDDTYDQWMKISAAQKDASRKASLTPSSPYARHAATDPALSWSYASPASILDANDYQDLAVDLAKEEMSRRRRAAGMLEEEQHMRLEADHRGSRNNEASRPAAPPHFMDDDELRRQMQATRRHLDRSSDYSKGYIEDEESVRPSTYSYPSISRSQPAPYERPSSWDRVEGPRPQPPRPPPKERYCDRSPVSPPPRPEKEPRLERPSPIRPPPRPDKELLPADSPPAYSPLREEAPILPPKTLVPDPAKQKRVTFRPAAYLENGEPIRPVFLPANLRREFLKIAADNTRKGLEMCGMLCGTTVNNALFISHLVIPEQRCTSDTCETENESAMLDFCIENDLIVIGWIHTHPTQTCFMSSRDLHTQAGYQVMMPESIAIVCAPTSEPSCVPPSHFHPILFFFCDTDVASRWGIFRLTNPPGLPHILSCQRTETFHQHTIDDDLYVEAGHPQGHVYESRTLEFEVCDLRPEP
jgi:STAM-binding protein